ncbi:hypothetical protein GCM10023206_06950 [Acinetobacter puyangensis]|uniref:Uncharacterized protein n=1 Tax=Acinetobacter puyangensis TaxID=1096779 RepID=A0A240E8J0_9GAMM|nr:hypothetical protein [Acinetobacter puyangensis]SNX44225.1 hypothetical protein SAMN05421731_102386 [Acinetobacter puyangensis]
MGALSNEAQQHFDAQSQAIATCAKYYFSNGQVAGFDSISVEPSARPEPLQAIFDSIEEKYQAKIDDAVRMGIEAYQSRNGGELPHPSVIASALSAGKSVAEGKYNQAMFDGLAQFDDISNGSYEQAAVVPAMTVVTIANVIANSLPIVAMLPNPTNSVRVPVVAVRYMTDSAFGAMAQGDYLDGANAALPYAEGRFAFALTAESATPNVYAVTARTTYEDFTAKTPNENGDLLPFLSGNVSLRVNGRELAHTRGDQNLSVAKGSVSATIKRPEIEIAGTTFTLNAVSVNIDTRTITATFDQALPANTAIEVHLVADFDAKDGSKKHLLNPVGVSLEPEYDLIQSVPVVNHINVSYNTNNQMANELGVGFVGAALAAMQGKYFLEQNVRLLKEAKDRAKYTSGDGAAKRIFTFDASRGATGNLTAAMNTTADLIREILKFIQFAKLKIRQASGGATVRFGLYVGDLGAVFFNQLDSSVFTKTGATASWGEIVRIGTLNDGTDVYHTPTAQGVVIEGVNAAEIMLVGNGNEPARNPMVGTITQPPIFREAKPDTRDIQFGLHAQMAAELNPLERYADQVALIEMINLPALGA